MTVRALFDHLLRGNTDAVDLCVLVFNWANVYDHLVDGQLQEHERVDAIHQAIWDCTVRMQTNPFYRRHQDQLLVTFANSITTWKAATALQKRTDRHSHLLAHVLRWVPIGFFLHCARIVGGDHWADRCAVPFWLAMTQDHSLEQFLTECGQPKEA